MWVPRGSGAYSIKPSLETLVTHDIQATILAATVEVTDIGVAEAIEAALGDARFALLVSPADHERTVKLARAHNFPGAVYAGPRMEATETGRSPRSQSRRSSMAPSLRLWPWGRLPVRQGHCVASAAARAPRSANSPTAPRTSIRSPPHSGPTCSAVGIGIGHIAVGMARQGYDVQLTRHSIVAGPAWEQTPRRAVRVAAWGVLHTRAPLMG